jgi:hypothetical protein
MTSQKINVKLNIRLRMCRGVPKSYLNRLRTMLYETEVTSSNPLSPSCVDISKKKKKERECVEEGNEIVKMVQRALVP